MIERTLQIMGLLSSLGIVVGLVLVLLQLKQAERGQINDSLNATDTMVGSAILGDDFYNTYYRVKVNAPDVTEEDKLRFGEFLEIVQVRIATDADYYAEDPKNILWILCTNFNNAVGIEWLEYNAKINRFLYPGADSRTARHLDIIKKGKCDGITSWSQHLSEARKDGNSNTPGTDL